MQKRSKLEKTESRWFYLFISPWLIGFFAFSFGPMLASIWYSLTDWNMFNKANFVGFSNYINLLTNDPRFSKSLGNTFFYAFLTVPLSLLLSILLTFLLTRHVRGLKFFRTLYYLPVLVPLTAVAFVFFWLFNTQIGIVNKFLALFGVEPLSWLYDEKLIKWVIVFMGLWQVGSSLLLTLAAVQGVPKELYEAAALDGAGNGRQFINITIPLVSPVLFFNLITSIISSLQVFTQSYVLTDGLYNPNNAALMMSNYLYQKGFADFEMGYACALGWIIFIIVIFFSAIVFRSSSVFVFYEGEVKKNEKKHKNHK
jgi:multiple sugar transport system permease protein